MNPALVLRLAIWLMKNKSSMPDAQDEPAPYEPEHKEGSVAWLQDSLNDLIGAGLEVDGIYGAATKAAISEYQKRLTDGQGRRPWLPY
jgi:peptidoglycan hydrolase-like protein with peptidoglycan-binding domain